MKDSWRSSFQDRLNEYELDVPADYAVSGRRVVWPWLLASAAAVAAVFLLLPGRKKSPDLQYPSAFMGEQPVTLLAEKLSRPRAIPESSRRHLSQSPDFISSSLLLENPVETPSFPQRDDVPARDDDMPETLAESTPQTTTGQHAFWPEEPDNPARRWSAQLFTQFQTRNGFASAGLPANQTTSSTPPYDIGEIEVLANALSNAIYANAFSEKDEWFKTLENYLWDYDLPIKAGLSLRYQITPVFGLESGMDYSFHHGRGQKVPGTLQQETRSYSFHYIGIPLKASLRLGQWNRLQAYATAGAEAEWLAAGCFVSKDGQKTVAVCVNEHPFQYSLMGAAGIDVNLSSRLSLYAEPGVSWHFAMKGTLPSYYREHPFSFDLRTGLRFTL